MGRHKPNKPNDPNRKSRRNVLEAAGVPYSYGLITTLTELTASCIETNRAGLVNVLPVKQHAVLIPERFESWTEVEDYLASRPGPPPGDALTLLILPDTIEVEAVLAGMEMEPSVSRWVQDDGRSAVVCRAPLAMYGGVL